FRFYLRVRTRFLLSIAAGLVWAGLSAWIAVGWTESLGRVVTLPVAVLIIGGIAIIPGYLNVQLVSSLILDRPRPIEFVQDYPDVTLLIAAYNEESRIRETLEHALRQDYPGKLRIVVADDGSGDRTREVAALVGRDDPRVRVVTTDHGGKSEALNAALTTVSTPLVATIDADTLLMPSALQRAIARMLSSPPDTVAVAGSVLVRNSREGALPRVQESDFFLAIASAKLREHGVSLLRGRRLHVHAVAANCLFPYLDTVYTIAIPIGVVLALTGNFLIVGPMTAAVLPISLMIALTMYRRQRAVFRLLGLRVRRNILGFVLYVLAYQLVMSPISVSGYATELMRARRVW